MIYLEDLLPGILYNGLNTAKAVDFSNAPSCALPSGTTVAGLLSVQAIGSAIGSTSLFNGTVTSIATQNGTPTASQLLGGIITHASTTGAGTLTTPTGTALSSAITGIKVGYNFQVLYANTGNQTVTITAGATGMTIVGTVAVPATKNAEIFFVNTAANTWIAYVVLSA